MHGSMNINKRVAKVTFRITVRSLPSQASVDITDVMAQPGGGVSGWLPHVTELPWAASINEETNLEALRDPS